MPLERLTNLQLPDGLSLAVMAQTLHSLQDAVTIADENDVLMYVNPAFTRMYGYEYDEVVGQPSSILWGTASASSARAEIFPTTMQMESWHGELNNRRKDGTEFPIQLTTAQVRDDHGKLVALVGVARDITQQRAYQAQLEHYARQMHEELSSAQRVQSVLLPPLESLERLLPEVLLLTIRRHLLSSELYWVSQHLDRSFLALANPGSSGVRAALASSLLYGLLNQIVNERLITQPDRIVEELDVRIAQLLDGDASWRDALNPAIGIFSFAKNLRTARFAGIDTGLIQLRKGKAMQLDSDPSLAAELRQQRPARASMYQTYALNLQFGDTLYCYTPGILQQLDPARQPLTQRELIHFFEGHQQLTMAEQARSLELFLTKRRGNQPPSTDGLLIGIRF